MRRLDMSNGVCVMICTHEWESYLKKAEGVGAVDAGTLSRRVRRENHLRVGNPLLSCEAWQP